MKVSGPDQRVADAARLEERGQLGDGMEADRNVLFFVERLTGDGAAAEGKGGVAAVVEDGGIGLDEAEDGQGVGVVAGFLVELAGGGLQGGLAGIDDSAGHLEGDLAGAEAVLLDKYDLLVGGEGDDVDPRVGFEDVEVMLAWVRGERQRSLRSRKIR